MYLHVAVRQADHLLRSMMVHCLAILLHGILIGDETSATGRILA